MDGSSTSSCLRAKASIAHMAGESTGGFPGSLEANGFRPTTPKTFDTTSLKSFTSPGAGGCISGSFTISCTESTIVFAMGATGDGVDGGSADGGVIDGWTATFADSATAGCLTAGGSASAVAGGSNFADFRDLVGCADLVARTSISVAETTPGSATDVSGSLTCGFRSETASGSATGGSGAGGSGADGSGADGSGADGSGADVLAGVSGSESFA